MMIDAARPNKSRKEKRWSSSFQALGIGGIEGIGHSLKMDSAGETWHISKVLASFSALAWFQFVIHQII